MARLLSHETTRLVTLAGIEGPPLSPNAPPRCAASTLPIRQHSRFPKPRAHVRFMPGALWRLCGLVELLEEGPELGEAFGAESKLPGFFHFADCLADDDAGPGSAWGEGDSFGALVVGV